MKAIVKRRGGGRVDSNDFLPSVETNERMKRVLIDESSKREGGTNEGGGQRVTECHQDCLPSLFSRGMTMRMSKIKMASAKQVHITQ